MKSLRVDLCDIRDPDQLAQEVHRLLEFEDWLPVPVTNIARELDIAEVRCAAPKGCEGMLLTDRVRSEGSILVNDAHGNLGRTRFTIAHELGHFLLEHHQPSAENGFSCSTHDMGIQGGNDRHAMQEAEANCFAIGLLAPANRYADLLAQPPDLDRALELGRELEISREAALRRLIALHPERLAVVFSRDGIIQVAPKGPGFPWLKAIKGHCLPVSLNLPRRHEDWTIDWQSAEPGIWCAPQHGPILQQVHVSTSGFLTILLHQPRVTQQAGPPAEYWATFSGM